ncbi:MAG TPA: hypothetical protein VIP98_09160 [Microlunatus sp.]
MLLQYDPLPETLRVSAADRSREAAHRYQLNQAVRELRLRRRERRRKRTPRWLLVVKRFA